jgi:hypothetical protein
MVSAYKEAARAIKTAGLHKDLAAWEHPYWRRGVVESRVFGVAESYKRKGIKVTMEQAKNGGGPYALLNAGPFELTISMIKAIDELPRLVGFRKEKSRCNVSLFADYEDEGERDTYYAVLAHLPHCKHDEPAAVRVKFPYSDYKGAYHVIDLKEKFAAVFTIKPVGEEKISPPKPKLRDDVDGKRDKTEDGREDS